MDEAIDVYMREEFIIVSHRKLILGFHCEHTKHRTEVLKDNIGVSAVISI